jgi:hypothetical protein
MARQIVIDFTLGPDRGYDIHRIRNFGEDLYRRCREDGWASISIHDVDRATDQLRVSVRSARRVRRIARMITELLEKHFLGNIARLSEFNQPE